MNLRKILLAVAMLLPAWAALAHHSTANFDRETLQTVTGVVKYFSFTNPHSFIDLEVKEASGEVRAYKIFTVGKILMVRHGWANGDVEPGHTVTITGHPDKKDATFMYLTRIEFASGKVWQRDTID